ncbi:hypothetical protein K461DRAFT_215728, partial [Myriangium duriaei CBS 260.36]
WLPFVMSDVTLLHTMLLLSASHCRSVHGPNVHAIDTITLRGWAIRGINESLLDRTKLASDELVAAVFNMATYEAIFGDRDTYILHMSGLRRLVEHRGGLARLGLDGLLERTLLWIDSNASLIMGFDDFCFPKAMFPSVYSHPPPDPQTF